jgi:hypothetical protein
VNTSIEAIDQPGVQNAWLVKQNQEHCKDITHDTNA